MVPGSDSEHTLRGDKRNRGNPQAAYKARGADANSNALARMFVNSYEHLS